MLVALAFVPAHAQNAGPLEPGAVQQKSNQTERYYGQQKAIQEGKKPLRPGEAIINKANLTATQPPSAAGPSFLLKKVETKPSAILSPAEISKIAAPYEGKKTNIGELLQIVGQINALYKQKGYLTARFNLFGPLQNEANFSHFAFECYLQSTAPLARLIHKY